MSLINIFAVAILLISSICWCRFSYVPFRKRKRVDTMDCFWICCDDADNVLSVNKINLGTRNTGGNVTWHTNKRSSGTWWCCTGEDDNVTYLFVEFVAGKGWYKRHVLQEVGPQLFKLMPVDHQFYGDSRFWTAESEMHYNEVGTYNVYLQQFQPPTEQPNYSSCPYEMYAPSRKTEWEEVISTGGDGSMCEIIEKNAPSELKTAASDLKEL